ncbi:hypothetical protein PG984_007294 [Apiospora sp. TS-2023a]
MVRPSRCEAATARVAIPPPGTASSPLLVPVTTAVPHTTTAVVVVDPTSVIVHSVTSTRKRTTTTNDDSVPTDGALPPAGPLQDPFKDSAPEPMGSLGFQGLIAIVANILYVWM